MYDTVQKCHERADTKRVLGYVNGIRKEFGMRPLRYLARGVSGESSQCSIAASLSNKYVDAEVDEAVITVTRYSRVNNMRGAEVQERRYEPLPKYVSSWINKFDNNKFPGMTVERQPAF